MFFKRGVLKLLRKALQKGIESYPLPDILQKAQFSIWDKIVMCASRTPSGQLTVIVVKKRSQRKICSQVGDTTD